MQDFHAHIVLQRTFFSIKTLASYTYSGEVKDVSLSFFFK